MSGRTAPIRKKEVGGPAKRLPDLGILGSIIPLRAVITNRGGPSLNRHVNLWYLHWWTLTHFVFEDPATRSNATQLVQAGATLEACEKHCGKVEEIEPRWHAHVRRIRAACMGNDPNFIRTGQLPP